MNGVTHAVRLELNKPAQKVSLSMRRGDTNTQHLRITILNNGAVCDMSQAVMAIFKATKPDQTLIYNDCTISGNEIFLDITNQTISALGEVQCQVEVIFRNEDTVTSPLFYIEVYDNQQTQDTYMESTNEYMAAAAIVAEAYDAAEQAGQATQLAQEILESTTEVAQQVTADKADTLSARDVALGASISAQSYANDAQGSAAEAESSREQAAALAANAALNAETAADKALEASGYASNASDSADAAAASAAAADQNIREATADVLTQANQIKDQAQGYANNAARDALVANNFASRAVQAEADAKADADEADASLTLIRELVDHEIDYAQTAHDWAVGPSDTSEEPSDENNAKHWAEVAQHIAEVQQMENDVIGIGKPDGLTAHALHGVFGAIGVAVPSYVNAQGVEFSSTWLKDSGGTVITPSQEQMYRIMNTTSPFYNRLFSWNGTEYVPVNGGALYGNALDDVSGAAATTFARTVSLTWTDPEDVKIDDVIIEKWYGTLVVRKEGSAPANRNDGVVVVNSQERNEYSSTPFVDNTVDYGITYYYRFFPYTESRQFTSGSSVSITPARIPIENEPSAGAHLTYDGTQQTGNFVNYDPTKMTATGTTGTEAGNYLAYFTPIEGYCWQDESYGAVSVEWFIDKANVSVPETDTSYDYDGQTHSVITGSYDHNVIQASGDLTETNVGSYTAVLSLIDSSNYEWTDHTTADKSISWSIAAAVLSIPVQGSDPEYDGTLQTLSFTGFDASTMNISGNTATNVGTYTATISLKDTTNYSWTGGSTTAQTYTWHITKASLTVPTVSSSLTYNGSAQSPTITGFNASTMTKTGDVETNAGSYTVTFSLRDTSNYEWSDQSITDKTASWSIAQQSVVIPSISGTLTYNGSPQSPIINNLNTAAVAVTGNTGTNAGLYTAVFTLKTANYIWQDNTTAAKTMNWNIAKAANTVTLSQNSMTLNSSFPTGSVSVTYLGDGTLSATAADPSKVTVVILQNNVSVTGISDGNTTVTVSVSEGTNYLAASATLSVTVIGFSVKVYGVDWDGTSTTVFSRTDDAANFTNPNPYYSGMTGTPSSPFDNISPWKDMVVSERTGGTMVAIPKFYFKLGYHSGTTGLKIQIVDGQYANWALANGYQISPAHMDRGDGVGERDVVYIGAYHCGVSNYKSKTGVNPYDNATIGAMRTNIHTLGANIWQIDYALLVTIWLLYLVEYADWNSQKCIGLGCGKNNAKTTNGQTDTISYHTGTTESSRDTYGYVKYRNISDLWSNVYDWVDGCYVTNGALYIIKNPASFSDNTGGTSVGTTAANAGIVQSMSIPSTSGFAWAMYPNTTGSSQTYDEYVSDDWARVSSGTGNVLFGGRYTASKGLGLFFTNAQFGASTHYASFGCRLMELP